MTDDYSSHTILVAPELAANIRGLQDACYRASYRCGWHNDLKTGLVRTAEENDALFPTRIALCHSELSEALEGHRKNLNDDKLPERKMAEVELADVIIRVCDLAGAMGYDLGGAVVDKLNYNASRQDHKPENRKAENGKAY
jgi:NTP pyrophosphatase (non-canonical NTP hydrolase)